MILSDYSHIILTKYDTKLSILLFYNIKHANLIKHNLN